MTKALAPLAVSFAEFQHNCKNRIEKVLVDYLKKPPFLLPIVLPEALQYAVLNGGKRLRPLLVYSVGRYFEASLGSLDCAAAAVELIHCYSLVHDDLPVMDNDDYRRGKPTCHKAFDECTALLVGDALQALAFQVLSENLSASDQPANRLKMVALLARAVGWQGMVSGQALDMYAENQVCNLDQLTEIHQLKTAALITAAVQLGAMAAGIDKPETLKALEQYAGCLGLAFQVQDDILDVIGSLEILGKTPGKDSSQEKSTFVALMGLAQAKEYAEKLFIQAESAIQYFENPEILIDLISFIKKRI